MRNCALLRAAGILLACLSCGVLADDMVLIDAGSYTPLYKSEDARNAIPVDAFLLDRYAVTNGEFYAFTQEHSRWQKANIKPIFADTNYLQQISSETLPETANQPVTNVSWFAARAYCKAQGKRLPTTDEWEYASHSDEPGFNERILRWYSRPAVETLPNVTDTPVNQWGVHGMHGVVWELVDDFNTALVTGESRGDSQLDQGLFCGAGAAAAIDPSNYAAFMRYALRSSYEADYTMISLGFRCAKDAPAKNMNVQISGGENDQKG